MLTVADLGEHALIERLRSRVPTPPAFVQIGIGDDAAVVVPERNALEVVTTDGLVEGVHFDRALAEAGDRRVLAVNTVHPTLEDVFVGLTGLGAEAMLAE